VTAAEAIAVAIFEEATRLAAKFEASGRGALTMVLAQEAEPGDPLRECWLAHERPRVSEARSISRAEIFTARADAAAEAAEVAAAGTSAAEAAAAEAASVAEAAAAVEAAAAAGAAAKTVNDAPGEQAALAPELPKEPGGSAGGMAEDVEELPVGPSREAFHRLHADRSGRKAEALDLVVMLGHKGESYSQAFAELGFQLTAMRLTAEIAVNVTRAFE
jgi:hypothetical protein